MSLLLKKFLIKNNYTHFNDQDVSLQLLTHPDNPSFRSMTDTLDYFGIENVAANVPEEALEMLPTDFLTLINLNGNGNELVLATKKNKFIEVEVEDGKKTKHTLDDFKKKWSKNIIAIEATNEKGLFGDIKNYWPILPITFLLIFFIIIEPTIFKLLRILLTGVGLFISYLLVKEKIGYHSPSVLNVCTSLPNSNCNDVINSKGGNITKNVSLADVSFLYFLVLLIANIVLDNNLVISTMLLLGLPVSLYSIYYQGLVLKKWCPLCLGIVFILCLLATSLIWDVTLQISNIEIAVILLFSTLSFPFYFYLKELIENNKEQNQEIIALRRFKRNPEIIKKIMDDAKTIGNLFAFDDEVIIGNKNAPKQIIAYTNPLCGFCKKAFESYVKIIEMYSDIKIIIRFNAEADNLNSPATQISSKLIEINSENGTKEFINAYISWFNNKNVVDWLQKYGQPKFENKYLLLIEQQKEWGKENEISYTPATIIIDKLFPGSYGYEDLVYVINDIIEFERNKNISI